MSALGVLPPPPVSPDSPPAPDTWLVYLLECVDMTLYCGVTNNLTRRLALHNSGRASKCTAARLPVRLLRAAAFPDKRSAMRAEYRVKRAARERKQEMLLRLSADANTVFKDT